MHLGEEWRKQYSQPTVVSEGGGSSQDSLGLGEGAISPHGESVTWICAFKPGL